jgi:hypothetical protein
MKAKTLVLAAVALSLLVAATVVAASLPVERYCETPVSQWDADTQSLNVFVACRGRGFEQLGDGYIKEFSLFEDGSFILRQCLTWGDCNDEITYKVYVPLATQSTSNDAAEPVCTPKTITDYGSDGYWFTHLQIDCSPETPYNFSDPVDITKWSDDVVNDAGLVQFTGCLPFGVCN